jgi:hypothetical protein
MNKYYSREELMHCFCRLGEQLVSEKIDLHPLMDKVYSLNPWFTPSSLRASLEALAHHFLSLDKLQNWTKAYPPLVGEPKTIGLVLAGNVPLVGWHDVLSVIMSGHHAAIKLSEKDNVLLPFLLQQAEALSQMSLPYTLVDRLSNFDAVIATGSNNSARYFLNYFSHVPHIIRKNRNSVALLTGNENTEELQQLADDVFLYFGLGCRNVSKLFVPKDYTFDSLFSAFEKYSHYKEHNKYMNNFDYQYSIALLNRETFFASDFIVLKQNKSIASAIATLHYEYYEDIEGVIKSLEEERESIQLVVSKEQRIDWPMVSLGKAQFPSLQDYADGVDTMEFLSNL